MHTRTHAHTDTRTHLTWNWAWYPNYFNTLALTNRFHSSRVFSALFPLSGTTVTVRRDSTSRSSSWFHGNTSKADRRSWVRLKKIAWDIRWTLFLCFDPVFCAYFSQFHSSHMLSRHVPEVNMYARCRLGQRCPTAVNWEPMTMVMRMVKIYETTESEWPDGDTKDSLLLDIQHCFW